MFIGNNNSSSKLRVGALVRIPSPVIRVSTVRHYGSKPKIREARPRGHVVCHEDVFLLWGEKLRTSGGIQTPTPLMHP